MCVVFVDFCNSQPCASHRCRRKPTPRSCCEAWLLRGLAATLWLPFDSDHHAFFAQASLVLHALLTQFDAALAALQHCTRLEASTGLCDFSLFSFVWYSTQPLSWTYTRVARQFSTDSTGRPLFSPPAYTPTTAIHHPPSTIPLLSYGIPWQLTASHALTTTRASHYHSCRSMVFHLTAAFSSSCGSIDTSAHASMARARFATLVS